ncbi:MAG: tRNA (adenosine(37)-N6)-dimethylallyltransferase MiaA, partial [Anaerolineales bacterium]
MPDPITRTDGIIPDGPVRSSDTPLLVIVGPTAVGKTEISLRIAPQLGGEIVSADSRYLYRGMDIGTAKPTPQERASVPHHLVDVADPEQPWSLAEYKQAAMQAIDDIAARGKLPMLVGGTGQYVRAVVEGWTIPPSPRSRQLRAALEREAAAAPAALHARLTALDPEAAARIDYRNTRRVVRALEVTLDTGIPFSQQRRKHAPPLDIFQLGLTRPRPELYARIDQRVDAMMEVGLLHEVEQLRARGCAWSLPAMSALGYKQIGGYLRGETDLPEAVRLIKKNTRRLVRRQANWFQATDPEIHWYDLSSETFDS